MFADAALSSLCRIVGLSPAIFNVFMNMFVQTMLDKCSEIATVLSLEFNAEKSQCIITGKRVLVM